MIYLVGGYVYQIVENIQKTRREEQEKLFESKLQPLATKLDQVLHIIEEEKNEERDNSSVEEEE